MIPYARLLLATEHTEFDTGAEQVALDLARRRGVPLAAVVPIVSNVEYESVAPELVARVEEGVRARVDALRDAAARAGVDLDLRVRRGAEPWREIVAEATERSADLLVVRRRGKQSFLANLMVGEMVGKVATAAPCSVLMVPRAARVWTRRVLAGIDGTHAGTEVARTAARMAAAAGLPLTLLSVVAHGRRRNAARRSMRSPRQSPSRAARAPTSKGRWPPAGRRTQSWNVRRQPAPTCWWWAAAAPGGTPGSTSAATRSGSSGSRRAPFSSSGPDARRAAMRDRRARYFIAKSFTTSERDTMPRTRCSGSVTTSRLILFLSIR